VRVLLDTAKVRAALCLRAILAAAPRCAALRAARLRKDGARNGRGQSSWRRPQPHQRERCGRARYASQARGDDCGPRIPDCPLRGLQPFVVASIITRYIPPRLPLCASSQAPSCWTSTSEGQSERCGSCSRGRRVRRRACFSSTSSRPSRRVGVQTTAASPTGCVPLIRTVLRKKRCSFPITEYSCYCFMRLLAVRDMALKMSNAPNPRATSLRS